MSSADSAVTIGSPKPPTGAPTVAMVEALRGIGHPLLRDAATRVAAAWQEAAGEALAEKEVVDELLGLTGSLDPDSGEVALPTGGAARLALRRRLLDLLRTELIEQWQQSDPPPEPREMLRLLGRFEEVRELLEPAWDEYFASRLTGPEGLELVMEIAHDLRSPLTSILFLAETLRRSQSGEINEVQHRQLGIIYSAALGLTSVVSDVIELARGGSRLMDKAPSPFSVAEIFDSVRDIVQPMAEEKRLSMRFIPPATDHRRGYPTALSRVLLNLTSNALKFTDDGFVEILARETSPTRVEFSVRDTGNGIKPEVLRNLYQPFRRVRGRSGYSFSGSGLGLAISRKLVEAMGGELSLETKPDWGTRFYFELELLPAAFD